MAETGPLGGNLGSSVEGLLSSFGIASAETRQSAEELAAGRFAALGFDVQVDSLRYGTLAVSCDPVTAHLLTYDRQEILEQLSGQLNEAVTALRIRVRHR